MFQKLNENFATKWFKKAAQTIQSKMPPGMIDLKTEKEPPIGELVLFRYDPKHKETLPYYDIHPLVLVCWWTNTDVYGINLHYIPPPIRKKLIEKMLELKDRYKPYDSKSSKKKYVEAVLPFLEAFGNSDMFSHTYKHYLLSNVRSKFGVINKEWWKVVIKLPLQDFKKASIKQVYADAARLRSKKSRKFGF